MHRSAIFLLSLFALAGSTLAADPLDPAALDFFEKKVRPVLVAHCYKCHSAEAAKTGKLKGELQLDSRDGWLKGGKRGGEIVPGKPGESRLIEAIHYTNEDLQMPPKDRLSAEIVADLEKWVAMGAPDPRTTTTTVIAKPGIDIEAGKKYWAFQPLHRYEPPIVKGDWARTPIDQFVLAKLNEKQLRPNPIAGRDKLIRRAYFDLLGLPPTPQEVTAFVKDPAPDAYEKLLDRLLESPRYGERWGRHWLDVARYGESDGFEQDTDRPSAYQYRDFVIRALNSDMPFDRFVQLQIAGDEIAPDDWQAMAATGFLTAGVLPTQITEREFELTRYNQLDDMTTTLGNAMLGLTIGCARCHDHKFDPIPSLDYYRLTAAFSAAVRSEVEVDLSTPASREKSHAEWQARVAAAQAGVDAFSSSRLDHQLDDLIAKVKRSPAALESDWSVLAFDKVQTAHGTQLVLQPDGSLLRSGTAPPRETYTLTARTGGGAIGAVRLEALADKSLPNKGPGAAGNGNFSLSEIEVMAAPADGSTPPARVKIVSAIATHEQNKTTLSVASSFDGKADTGWAVDMGGIGKDQAAIFNFEKPVGFPGGTALTITLRFEHPNPRHSIGRPRLSVTQRVAPKNFKGVEGPDPAIAQTLKRLAADEPVADADRRRARDWLAGSLPEFQKLKAELTKLQSDGPPGNLTKVSVTSEGLPPVKNFAGGYPFFYKDFFQLRRGDPNNKIAPATPSFPQILMRGKDATEWQTPAPTGSRNSFRRTGLAQWIVDVDHGAGNLLARVIVNRLWQHHFGRGIVATPNDFGIQGERPTHPELLDWLACDLVDHGWKLKRLHKLMMAGAAYMQSAAGGADRIAVDPHDVYMWRRQPRRLEAEPIRDSMLAVSGMLDETMFGPGTLDQNMRRRSIYFQIKRSQLIPMMMVLDWPEPLTSVGVRPVTTVAPQALLFLNSAQARQYAEGFARRVASQSIADCIARAYGIAFGREPEKFETAAAITFIETQARSYREAKAANPDAAALADFCQALMSANEFVYVE